MIWDYDRLQHASSKLGIILPLSSDRFDVRWTTTEYQYQYKVYIRFVLNF